MGERMKGYKWIGTIKSTKYNQIDKIYYNPRGRGKFKCIDKNGDKRNLSEKQKKYLYNKFHIKCDLVSLMTKVKIYTGIAISVYTALLAIKYRNILEDTPKIAKEFIFDEKVLKEERNIETVINYCQKYIESNNEFTEKQKEYLIEEWRSYLKENGECLEILPILELYNNLSTVHVDYSTDLRDKTVGEYNGFLHKINISKDYEHVFCILFHETLHCFIRDNISHNLWAIEEGFCSAIGNIPHDYLSYSEENEYLLILSEMIEKEKIIYYIENFKEEEFYKYLASCTNNTEEDVKDCLQLMNTRLRLYLNSEDNYTLEEINKEIKQTLASWAIKVDERNQDNFIALNVLYDKYVLTSSFLEENYVYLDKETGEEIIINDENKYDFTYLFEENLVRAKIHNK